MSELCYRIFTPQRVVKRREASSCRKALSSGTLHDGTRERAHLLPLLRWSESATDPHGPCSIQKQIVCSAHISNTLSKTMSIDSMQDCIKPRLSYRPYGSLECIFLLHRVETRHFFLLLWYIYLSTLQQSLFLIYALFVGRINYSLSAVVSKIPFNKWQSVSLTKENEVVNKENGFSRTSNIWRLRLSWK